MLPKIAWRNIWRNKMRSLVVVASVAIGLWAGMFTTAFSWGLYTEHIHDAIENQLSHIQIHNPSFEADKAPEFTIADGRTITERLKKDGRIKGVSGRIVTSGMISSPVTTAGVLIMGIDPDDEKQVSSISKNVVEGTYFNQQKKNEILIGEKLATKLRVKLRGKIVLTFQSKDGDITAGAFRVAGIFRSRNSSFDELSVFIRAGELSQLLGTGNEIHEIALLLKRDETCDGIAKELKATYPTLQVQTWKNLSPELELVIDSFQQYMFIFIAIILLALMFGIVNTMLMAVLERQRELGILMAIGLNRWRLFMMIVLETVFLVMLGIPLGILITSLSVNYFNQHGIDVSSFSEGLAQYGFSTVIHPELEASYYFPVALMTAGAALLSAIYPAIKALQLKPAVAIRKI